MEAAGERGKWDILVEGGVPAALELGVVGDCRFSHCTIDDWGWLGLRIQVKDRINTTNTDNSPNPMARMPASMCLHTIRDRVLSVSSQDYNTSHSRRSHISNLRHFTELLSVGSLTLSSLQSSPVSWLVPTHLALFHYLPSGSCFEFLS